MFGKYGKTTRALALFCAILLTVCVPSLYAAADGEHMTIAGVDLGYAPGDCYPDTEESFALTGSVQCMAFARYCQTMVYGVNDFNAPEQFRDIVGRKSPEECTVENLKKWFMGCAPATHLRCPGGSKPMHSMAIAETGEEKVHMIHGNWYPGNIVAETDWTWEKFADQMQSRGGIVFAMSYVGKGSESLPGASEPPEPADTSAAVPSTLPEEDGELVGPVGDVNADGKTNTKDARLTLRFAAKLEVLTAAQRYSADADANGKVNAADARKILRAAAKLETLG